MRTLGRGREGGPTKYIPPYANKVSIYATAIDFVLLLLCFLLLQYNFVFAIVFVFVRFTFYCVYSLFAPICGKCNSACPSAHLLHHKGGVRSATASGNREGPLATPAMQWQARLQHVRQTRRKQLLKCCKH